MIFTVVLAALHSFCTLPAYAQRLEDQIIEHGDPAPVFERFGSSISINNDRIVVGAPGKQNAQGTPVGAAYVFRRNPMTGLWFEEQKLLASDGGNDDRFGWSVDIDDDRLVVGAPNKPNAQGTRTGFVYVYRYDDDAGVWFFEQRLDRTPNDQGNEDQFGASVAIHDDLIVVGAPNKPNSQGTRTGATYAFRRAGNSWIEEQKIEHDNQGNFDEFGAALTLDEERIIVGAPNKTNAAGTRTGLVYSFVYSQQAQAWIQEQEIQHDEQGNFDRFGSALSQDGDRFVAGAPDKANAQGTRTGATYTFVFDSILRRWIQEQKIEHQDQGNFDEFGSSVSLDRRRFVVGAPNKEDPSGRRNGTAYVFLLDDLTGRWIQEMVLETSDQGNFDEFGSSASFDGGTAVFGAPNRVNSQGHRVGAAYAYRLYTLSVTPNPLIVDEIGVIRIEGGDPFTKTYLAVSLKGFGSYYVPLLDVTLDLDSPFQLGNAKTTDDRGVAEWSFTVPRSASGRDVTIQGTQIEKKTNVVAMSIE